MSSALISFTVTHRGTSYPLTLLANSTLASLHVQLEELTGVPRSMQKLLYKAQKKTAGDAAPIVEAGIKDGLKVQMLGSTPQEIVGLQATENEQQRINRIMRERAMKTPVKVRSTGTSSSATLNYRFHSLEPLPHLPKPSSALEILTRISNDPAVRHVMQKYKFSVGLLTELAPHENPELLGLNVNRGQAIKLRIRTDAYDGFRPYLWIRKVLCHELAHNEWSNHDENFKELNSRINKEVAEFERAAREGTHDLMGGREVYEPSEEFEAKVYTHILGGSGEASISLNESREDRRQRVLQATMNRLQREEEELEQSCGTGSATEIS